MKTKFSKFSLLEVMLCILTIGLLFSFTTPAFADDAEAVSMGSTNTIAANATTTANLGSGTKIDKQFKVALVMKYQNSTTGNSNNIVKLVRGYTVSGSSTVWYETTPIASLSFTNAAASGVASGATNVFINQIPDTVIGSAGYLKAVSWQNTDTGTGACTNAALYLLKKVER